MMRVASGPGRVVMGPKKLHRCYARIVSMKDGSGCIESYDPRSGTWSPAHESITFSEVWSAPPAPALMTPLAPAGAGGAPGRGGKN